MGVTERKRAEEELLERTQHMQLATEATGVGIWEWNLVTNDVRWDPQMFRIYGIDETADGIVPFSTWTNAVLPEEMPEQENLLRQHALQGGISRRQFRIRRRNDGQIRHISACEIGRADATGRRRWVVGTNLDVTDSVLAEARLRAADRRKDEFIATLAHELRNPLAAIRAATFVLHQEQDRRTGSGGEAKALAIVDRQLSHLIRLVDDLLDVSRIKNGSIALKKTRVDLSETVRRAIETAQPVIDKGRHQLQVELPGEPAPLDADPVRISQIICNLLHNAAKFTDPGGLITVKAQTQDGEAVVRVIDNGVGIAPEALPGIFEHFMEAGPTPPHVHRGLGVGLGLAKSLAQLHGGAVEAHSDGPGHGSTFTLRLPLAEVREA